MWFHLRSRLSPNWRALAQTIALAGTVAVTIIVVGGDDLLPETRLTKQISVIRTQLRNVAAGAQISYYDEERTLGTGSTSAIWRLAHWRRTLGIYADGTTAQHLLGFGIGSSPVILGILPHNEYLRVLFEQGIAGLFLFLFAWRLIILKAPPAVRYVGWIVAIYSFSENNLDNFPFMSLFILFLSATELYSSTALRTRIKQDDLRVIRFPGQAMFLFK